MNKDSLSATGNNLNNKTEIYDHRVDQLNLSSTLTHNERPDEESNLSMQVSNLNWDYKGICKELFYNKKFSKNVKMTDKVKEQLAQRNNEDARSVISSDNEPQSTGNRKYTEMSANKEQVMHQSSSSKTRKTKKFVIKKSSVRADDNHVVLGNYRVNKRLAGILEQQLQFLMNSKNNANVNQSIISWGNEQNRDRFLPYKNVAQLLSRHNQSKSQRSRRKLTVSNNKVKHWSKAPRSDNISARSNYSRANKLHTPRYNGNKIRLVNGKDKIVAQHKKSSQYNERSRQVNSSGLRSNTKTRNAKCPNLIQTTSACNYTQDMIPKHTLTDKSYSVSKD